MGQHHCDLQNTLLAFFIGQYGKTATIYHLIRAVAVISDQNAFKVDCCSPKRELSSDRGLFWQKNVVNLDAVRAHNADMSWVQDVFLSRHTVLKIVTVIVLRTGGWVPTMPIWAGCKMCLRSLIYGRGDSSLHASAQMHSAKSTKYTVQSTGSTWLHIQCA